MKIVFSKSFKKKLSKIGSINRTDIIKLLLKYPNTNNIVELDFYNEFKVLKCYLLSKKVRALVLFQFIDDKFVPITIVKKESHSGRNIIKENYIELFESSIIDAIQDIDNGDFEEEDF